MKITSSYTQAISSSILPNDSSIDAEITTIINNYDENKKLVYFDQYLLIERDSEFQKYGINLRNNFFNEFQDLTEMRIVTEYTFQGAFKDVTPQADTTVPIRVEVYSDKYNFVSINAIIFDQIINMKVGSSSFRKTAQTASSNTYTLTQQFKFNHVQYENIKLASIYSSGMINCLGAFCHNKVILGGIELYLVMLPGLVGIIMGIVVLKFAEKTQISNSLLLLLIGMVFGATLFTQMQMSQVLSPRMIMWLLLPPLLFESASTIDFHIFSKLSPQILLLAGPGVLFCTFSTGYLMYAFGFANDFNTGDDPIINYLACCVLGAITAATDPVAVISLFKELGTEKKISILIEGESLLNDGSGVVTLEILIIVLISLLNNYHGGTGGGSSSGELVWTAAKLAIGGPLLGLLGAWIVKSLLKYIQRPNLQAVFVFINIYIVFFVGEHFLGCSGVLAICSYGLYFSARGNIYLSREGKHMLHEFTCQIAWMSETVIFLISGVILGEFFRNSINNMSEKFGYIFLLYVILILTRAAMLILAYPVMYFTGYGFGVKRFLLLNWSALRGAVGLCGALIVMGELEFPLAFQNLVVFYTGGIVVLTILLNGSTCSAMMEYIGMSHLWKDQVEDNLECTSQINEICLQFQKDDNIPMLSKLLCKKIRIYDYIKADYLKAKSEMLRWVSDDIVYKENYTVKPEVLIDPLEMEKQFQLDLDFMNRVFKKDTDSLYKMLLLSYFKSIKYYYFQKFDKFYLSRENFQILLSSVNYAIDNIHKPDKTLNDSDASVILEYMRAKYRNSYLVCNQHEIKTMNYLNMQILNTFKTAHHQALQKVLSEYLGTNEILIDNNIKVLASCAHVEVGREYYNNEPHNVIDENILEILHLLVTDSNSDISRIDNYIVKYKMYDDYNFNYAYEESIKLLNSIEKKIKQLNKDGLIDESKLDLYIDQVHDKRYKLFDAMNYLEQEEIEMLYIDSFKYYFSGGKNAIKDEEVDELISKMLSIDEQDKKIYKELQKENEDLKFTEIRQTAKIIVREGDRVKLSGCYLLFDGSIRVEFENGKTVSWENANRIYRMVVGVNDSYTLTAAKDSVLYKINVEYVISEYFKIEEEVDSYKATVCRTILSKYISEYYYKMFSMRDEQLVKITGEQYVYQYEQVLELIVSSVMTEELALVVLNTGMKAELNECKYYYVAGRCAASTDKNFAGCSLYEHMVLHREDAQNYVMSLSGSVLVLKGSQNIFKEMGAKVYKYSINKVSLLQKDHVERYKTFRTNSKSHTLRNQSEYGWSPKTNNTRIQDYTLVEHNTIEKIEEEDENKEANYEYLDDTTQGQGKDQMKKLVFNDKNKKNNSKKILDDSNLLEKNQNDNYKEL